MVAGMFIGALQPFMVILGLHWGLFPIALNNVAVYGYDTIMALFGGAIFAQGGAALAVAVKAKDATFKSQALSASLTALLGITEPAMFGVNLRLKKPMACACVAGGIGSSRIFRMPGRFICIACTHDIVGIYESCLCSVFNFTGGCFWVSICIYNDGSNS